MEKNVRMFLLSVILMTLGISANAQPAQITEIPGNSTNFITIRELVYFTAGSALWRTDGTASGTFELGSGFEFNSRNQFRSSIGNSSAVYFTNLQQSGLNGKWKELWRSDGTPAGTVRVHTSADYDVRILGSTVNGLIFTASDPATGLEVHIANGTSSELIKDINPGPTDGYVDRGDNLGQRVIFAANDGTHGTELWITSASEGASMLKDINPGPGDGFVSSPGAEIGYVAEGGVFVDNQTLYYFTGNDPSSGKEPWVSNGTSSGTQLLKNVVPGSGSPGPIEFKVSNNMVTYFMVYSADRSETTADLWKTNGTPATTAMIKKVDKDHPDRNHFMRYSNDIYFFAWPQQVESNLWVSDGTNAGTEELFRFYTAEGGVSYFEQVNGGLLFYGNHQGVPTPLFRHEPFFRTTKEIIRFNSAAFLRGPRDLTDIDGELLFYADHDGPSDNGEPENEEDYYQLFQSDGYTTRSLRDIFGISFKGSDNIARFKSKMILFTTDGQTKKLWKYDPSESIGYFTLVNADTDEDIQRVNDNEIITLPEDVNFSVRFDPLETAGSIRFSMGGGIIRLENQAPYSIAGDANGNYAPWTGTDDFNAGLTANIYSEPGGKGTLEHQPTIHFEIKRESGTLDCNASGTILREQWNNVSGNNVSAIPVTRQPNSTSQLNIFEGPTNSSTNFGARIRGYICPPTTGNYTFWIASNDHSELWLSTDDNPSNKVKIASVTGATTPRQWTKFPSQKSAAINLTAGKRYYIEALHKQGAGSHNIAVGWQLPDGALERPIPGNRLSPFYQEENLPPNVLITYPWENQAFNQPTTVTIETDASDHEGDLVKVEFFEGANKLGEVVSPPYNFTWENVPPGNYNLSAKATDGQGATDFAYVSITVNEGDGECTASGTITREYWANVPGARVSDIPVNTSPTSTNELTIFEGPSNIGSNYGTRIRGYICPPVSGGYNFWIASNDHSELWLSTDDNAANKVRIAYLTGSSGPREWGKNRSQLSTTTIMLVAGRRYYIEALHKQGVGSDHVAVGWQLPDGAMERPIPGSGLSPFEMNSARMASDPDNNASTEKDLYSQINIYPNPVQSGDPELTIAGYERVEEPVETQVEIINMTGEVVFADRILCGGNCSAYLMDINKHLVPGVYLVNMKTNGTRNSRRLLVK
ncbi:MAG: PA14 domain-containing protein [Cyclobacteriaceae bacterium]